MTDRLEEIAEKEILNLYKNNIQIMNSTILKAGHHGSKTSSTKEFVKVINPKVVIIGVGENNKFGHPNEEVIERFNSIGCRIYRTDQMGEIIININSEGKYKIKKYLEKEKNIN